MALQLVQDGPKMNWTMDSKIYDQYLIWKSNVELIFSSALLDSSALQKSAYLRLWMGDEGKPLLNKWVSTGRIEFDNPEEIPATETRPRVPQSNGFIIQTFWDLLEEELRPKGNKLISIPELLSTKSKQGSKPLNEWLSYIYNLVEVCNYGDSKDRIIRDILFNGCASRSARDKIIRVGDKIKLAEVLEILHSEDAAGATHESIKEIDHYNSNFSSNPVAQVHYASYKKNQKSRKKTSTEQNTDSKRLCYRCGEPYSKEHEPKCRAQNATCNACGKEGHFQKVCRTTGKKKRPNPIDITTDRKTAHTVQTISSDGYYNETGDWVPAIPSSFRPSNIASVNTLSDVSDTENQFSTSTSTSPRENQISTSTGSKLYVNDTEKQPIQQKSVKTAVPSVLQVSQRSPGNQDIQQSLDVTATDADTDADTYYKKVSSFYFQKNPRNTGTNVLQRKGEVTLSFPIDPNQFQQFCKQLNTKEIILCTDLLQQELYG